MRSDGSMCFFPKGARGLAMRWRRLRLSPSEAVICCKRVAVRRFSFDKTDFWSKGRGV